MSHEVCRQVDEWIEEEVSRRVETWVEEQRQVCQQQSCNWLCLCCNKWWCGFVSVIVAAVYWVVEKVVRLVTRTVCELIASVVDIVVNVLGGLIGFFVALFSGNWSGAVNSLSRLFLDGLVKPLVDIARIRFGGDAIDFIREEINEGDLKAHVQQLLAGRFAEDLTTLAAVSSAISLNAGAFGLRMRCRMVRLFLDSDRDRDAFGVPAVVRWHEGGLIDLRLLAGVNQAPVTRAFRPDVADASDDLVVGTAFDTDPVPQISASQLEAYIAARGIASALPQGFKFRVYGCNRATLALKTSTATLKARALGLLLSWNVEDLAATSPTQVMHPGNRAGNREVLVERLGRANTGVDPIAATADFCRPACALTILYSGCESGAPTCLRGLASLLTKAADCPDPKDNLGFDGFSGVTFRDNVSDFVFKYVLIHELGHYFGLCHVDGVDRVMFTGANKSIFSWSMIPELYLSAEPRFTIGEAKRSWDYIVANAGVDCLNMRPDPPSGTGA